MCSDAVGNKLAMVPLSNNTIKWRIQEISVNILQQHIAAAPRSGSLILQLDETQRLVVIIFLHLLSRTHWVSVCADGASAMVRTKKFS